MLLSTISPLLLVLIVGWNKPCQAQKNVIITNGFDMLVKYESRSDALALLHEDVYQWQAAEYSRDKFAGFIIMLSENTLLAGMTSSPEDGTPMRALIPTPRFLTYQNPLALDKTGKYRVFQYNSSVIPSVIGLYRRRISSNEVTDHRDLGFTPPNFQTRFPMSKDDYKNCSAFFWSTFQSDVHFKRRAYTFYPLSKLLKLQFPDTSNSERYGYGFMELQNITCHSKRDCFGLALEGEFCMRDTDNNIPVVCGPDHKFTFILGRTKQRWDELDQKVPSRGGESLPLCHEIRKVELIPVSAFLDEWRINDVHIPS